MRAGISRVLVALLLVGSVVAPSAWAADGGSAAPELGSSDWRSVSASEQTTCGVTASGRLYCWGADHFGQLGDSRILVDRATPVRVFPYASDWASVSAGGSHTCAVKTTGRLFCWGSSSQGALGAPGRANFDPTAVEVLGNATNWASVSAGAGHTCAIKTSGRLFCWGFDQVGQLGDDSRIADRWAPTQVAGGSTKWQSVSTGVWRTCAIRTTGRLYGWGSDHRGALGDGGTNTDRHIPVQVGTDTDWASVAAGGYHTCAIKTTGQLFCWGSDDGGALGDNAPIASRHTPTQVAGAATDWASVTAGYGTTCARKTTGQLYCWGYDTQGTLGDGGTDTDRHTPVQVAGNATDWTFLDSGSAHSCAGKISGRLYCWGANYFGELGDGSHVERDTPSEVAAH